jgi:putative sporulation protein YyaC
MPEINLKTNYSKNDAVEKVSYELLKILTSKISVPNHEFIMVCIGTDRSTGDCLGPLIGTKLNDSYQDLFKLYGTLDEPVHAANLSEVLQSIDANHPNRTIIAIDACLGNLDSIGNINVGTGPIKPGAGVNKELPPIGDYNITGIVNVGGFMEYFVLQNTRLNIVMKMSNIITASIINSILEYKNIKNC